MVKIRVILQNVSQPFAHITRYDLKYFQETHGNKEASGQISPDSEICSELPLLSYQPPALSSIFLLEFHHRIHSHPHEGQLKYLQLANVCRRREHEGLETIAVPHYELLSFPKNSYEGKV